MPPDRPIPTTGRSFPAGGLSLAAAGLPLALGALIGLASLLGVGRPANPVPAPEASDAGDAGLGDLLAYYDPRYDPAAAMVRVRFASPGYHSRLPDGAAVHPTRESLVYAVALLRRDGPGDAERAAAIVRRVVALQDAGSRSPTRGVWPWHAEEPLGEMAAPDFNWADFCGVLLAQMLVERPGKLPADLRDEMRAALGRASEAVRRRDAGPAYTNVAVVGGSCCAAAGELLGDRELLDYGRRRMEGVVAHAARHGGFTEYNSPPYTRVAIAECERALLLVRDPATRAAAESLRRTGWRTLAGSFHPPTAQLAGPHARASSVRLEPRVAAFLSRRTGAEIRPHPAVRADDRPDVYAVLTPRPCPAEFRPRFRDLGDVPREVRRTFLRGGSGEEPLVGTTWMDGESCLGSASRSGFWTQRKPLLAYWRTDADPAAAFRLRFLHDGRDFASMAVRTTQSANRTLSVLHPVPGRGDWHRTLDRPADGMFHAGDLRARFELDARGATAEALPGGRFVLAAGGRRAVVHAAAGRFAGRAVEWRLGRDGDRVFLDAVCHAGDRRAFDFDGPPDMVLVAGIELLPDGEAASDAPPVVTAVAGPGVEASWEPALGVLLRVSR